MKWLLVISLFMLVSCNPQRMITRTLDGSKSYDPDGDAITYRWQQISGSPALIYSPYASVTKVEINQPATFILTVTDKWGATGVDTVSVLK